MSRKTLFLTTLLAALAVTLTVAPTPVEAQTYSYAVKFVCGFNRTNLGITEDGDVGGENVVKLGNYATDINIFNPSNDTEITKKAILLVKDGKPVGREPKVVGPSGETVSLGMPFCSATYDDCNEILRLAGIPPFPGVVPGLFIGFLIIQSPNELDVTAVYTAEICTDQSATGGTGMCQSPPGTPGFASGAGISIDVEQIQGKKLP